MLRTTLWSRSSKSTSKAGGPSKANSRSSHESAEQIAGLNRILHLGFAVWFLCAYDFSAGEPAPSFGKTTFPTMTTPAKDTGLKLVAAIGLGLGSVLGM